MVPGLVAGHYTLGDCSIPLGRLAAAAKATFAVTQATAIDAAARRVTLANGETLQYDRILFGELGVAVDHRQRPDCFRAREQRRQRGRADLRKTGE